MRPVRDARGRIVPEDTIALDHWIPPLGRPGGEHASKRRKPHQPGGCVEQELLPHTLTPSLVVGRQAACGCALL
ncbi:MAG: hypothetical protein ACYCYG_12085 [Bellilinea sp.]